MTNQRILNILRWTFLSLSLACAATAAAWRFYPEGVAFVDQSLVAHHQHAARRDVESAARLLADGKPLRALKLYEDLAGRLQDVKPGDRNFPRRRTALENAAQLRMEAGEFAMALTWSEELAGLDERDMHNSLRRADLLSALGRKDEARTLLAVAARITGTDPKGQAQLLESVARAEDAGMVVELLLNAGDASLLGTPTVGWDVFHRPDASGKFTRVKPTVQASGEEGRCTVTAELSSEGVPVTSIRLDLPPRSLVSIRDLALTLTAVDGSARKVTLGQPRGRNGVAATESGWSASGGSDPYLTFVLAEGDIGTYRAATFTALCTPRLPANVADLLRSSGWEADRAELVATHGEPIVARLEAALDA